MQRRSALFVLPVMATALILTGVHVHLRAQEVKPLAVTTPRPHLREWQFPGMNAQFDRDYPNVATLTGKVGLDYAQVFDFYAKKIGGSNYDLKQLATFQSPQHEQLSVVATDMNASSDCYASSQTLHATFCRRSAHESVSIFLYRNKQDRATFVSLTATTF